jgi:hypothetical protein
MLWSLNDIAIEKTAYNKRFCEMAAVTPQIGKCLIASYYPAANSVEATTSQSRRNVMAQYALFPAPQRATQYRGQRSIKLNVKLNINCYEKMDNYSNFSVF